MQSSKFLLVSGNLMFTKPSVTDECNKSKKRTRYNIEGKLYQMQVPEFRQTIIMLIDEGKLVSECNRGKREKWWEKKHHPSQKIPTNIHSLGDGTIQELYEKYINAHGSIERSEFINYTRELIKQGIMY